MFKKLVVTILIGLLSYPPFAFAGGAFDSKTFPGLEPDTYDSCILYWNQGDARMYGDGSFMTDGSGGGNHLEQALVGASQPVENATYLHWDGTDDFMSQEVLDSNQGAMTFVADAGTAEFRDAGQAFAEWETTSGSAKYSIIITTDNGTSWGYLGASNNSGLDIDVYSDKALTTRGWKERTTPQASPDTAASYEIRVTDFNVTDDFSGFAVVRLDDGQPGANNNILGKYTTNAAAFRFIVMSDGVLRFYISGNGTTVPYENTSSAVFPNDQTGWYFVGFSYDASAGDCIIYSQGVAVTSTEVGTLPTSIYDTSAPFAIGALNVDTTPTWFLKSDLAASGLFDCTMTAAEHLQVYNSDTIKEIMGR